MKNTAFNYETWKDKMQHHLNPLRFQAKLRKYGVKRQMAKNISQSIEKILRPMLYQKPREVTL